jgi:hypothetical protein
MALMLGSLYQALRSVEVPDDKAKAAAEEVAGFENRLSDLRTDVRVLQAMVGFLIAVNVTVAIKLFMA